MLAFTSTTAPTPQAYLALEVQEEEGRRHDDRDETITKTLEGDVGYRLIVCERRLGVVFGLVGMRELGGDARVIVGSSRTRQGTAALGHIGLYPPASQVKQFETTINTPYTVSTDVMSRGATRHISSVYGVTTAHYTFYPASFLHLQRA